MNYMFEWGMEPFFIQQLEDIDQEMPVMSRIVEDLKGMFRIISPWGEALAELSGKLRAEAEVQGPPVVGDWVVVRPEGGDRVIIDRVLERKSVLNRTRRDSNRREASPGARQPLAANLDAAFIVCALTDDPNLRSIERYLTLVHGGGVWPVIVLTKADLREDAEMMESVAAGIAPGVDVVAVSSLTGQGLDRLEPYLASGKTSVLLGPSGVGKSTLINRLMGSDAQKTGEVRAKDAKGRHVTTTRHLFRLPGGGLIIDTPGMRALGLTEEDGGFESVFGDVLRFAAQCRFRDCRHENEPGCAVRAAVESGDLDRNRLENYLKMRKESAAIERARDKQAAKKAGKEMAQMIAEVKRFSKRRY